MALHPLRRIALDDSAPGDALRILGAPVISDL
jgi:hypothetical protein